MTQRSAGIEHVWAKNVDAAIRDFRAPTAGNYFARVIGPTGSLYQLVVTRGAAFEWEPNNSVPISQPLRC